MLFNDFITCYLFFGGVGGGLCLCALFIRLRKTRGGSWAVLYESIWIPALIGSLLCLAAGTLCLMKDLTRSDKALLLFTQPTLSAISIGTFALLILIICVFGLIAVSLVRVTVSNRIRCAFEIAAAIGSIVVVLYTGLLLSSITAVPLWLSACIPILFTLSSLSSGFGALALICAFTAPRRPVLKDALVSCFKIDTLLIGLELATLVVFAFQLSGNEVALASIEPLLVGNCAYQFWGGFIGLGLIVPFFGELILSRRLSSHPAFCLVIGCLILVGAFYLRYCVIFGTVHLSVFMFA